MAGIETEISRLKSKDVKVKRRAVRHLFEADVPSALKGFIPLLTTKIFGLERNLLKHIEDGLVRLAI